MCFLIIDFNIVYTTCIFIELDVAFSNEYSLVRSWTVSVDSFNAFIQQCVRFT